MKKFLKNNVDWNPSNRAFTGGVGKPVKPRKNDGRKPGPSPMGVQYAASGASPSRVKSSAVCKVTGIYNHLAPYANPNPPKVVHRAPKHYTPQEKKRWHKLRKLGII
jgi:hypothetical protein